MKNLLTVGNARRLGCLTAIILFSGCAGLDRFGTKLDVVANRLSEPGHPLYEGQLTVVRKVGSMTAMQFADGETYDVSDAPPALLPGDTVRIYAAKQGGYQALPWTTSPTHGG